MAQHHWRTLAHQKILHTALLHKCFRGYRKANNVDISFFFFKTRDFICLYTSHFITTTKEICGSVDNSTITTTSGCQEFMFLWYREEIQLFAPEKREKATTVLFPNTSTSVLGLFTFLEPWMLAMYSPKIGCKWRLFATEFFTSPTLVEL